MGNTCGTDEFRAGSEGVMMVKVTVDNNEPPGTKLIE